MVALAGARVLASDNARVYTKAIQNTPQAFGAATFTAMTFDGADEVDTLGIHDPVTNNSRLNIGLLLGWWLVIAHTPWGGVSASGKRSRLVLNGVTGINGGYVAIPAVTATTAGFQTTDSVALVQATAAADYVQCQAYTDLAASTQVSGDLRATFTAIYQGP